MFQYIWAQAVCRPTILGWIYIFKCDAILTFIDFKFCPSSSAPRPPSSRSRGAPSQAPLAETTPSISRSPELPSLAMACPQGFTLILRASVRSTITAHMGPTSPASPGCAPSAPSTTSSTSPATGGSTWTAALLRSSTA